MLYQVGFLIFFKNVVFFSSNNYFNISINRLKNYMRAVIDCDYVINKLEEKNLRSWLYRAVAYKMAGDEKNFSISVDNARKTNPKKQDYIIDFLEKAQLQGI